MAYNLTAGGTYSIKITRVANTSKYFDGTFASYTFTVTLDLISGSVKLITTQAQSYKFGPGEERSIVNGNPFIFSVTMPASTGNSEFVVSIIDQNSNVTASGSANVNLTAAIGYLAINSTPSGANVFINNSPQGVVGTPLNINIPVGVYTLTLKLAGYQDFTQQVTVTAGQTTTVNATMVAASGNVPINSTPSGAQITIVSAHDAYGNALQISNPNLGTTPLTATLPTNIAYQFKASLAGYLDSTLSIIILPGVNTPLNFGLVASIPNFTDLPVGAAWGIVGGFADSAGVHIWIKNVSALSSGLKSSGYVQAISANVWLNPNAPTQLLFQMGEDGSYYAYPVLVVGTRHYQVLYDSNYTGPYFMQPAFLSVGGQFVMPPNGQTIEVTLPWFPMNNDLTPFVPLSITDLINMGYLSQGFQINFNITGFYGPIPQQYGSLPQPALIVLPLNAS